MSNQQPPNNRPQQPPQGRPGSGSQNGRPGGNGRGPPQSGGRGSGGYPPNGPPGQGNQQGRNGQRGPPNGQRNGPPNGQQGNNNNRQRPGGPPNQNGPPNGQPRQPNQQAGQGQCPKHCLQSRPHGNMQNQRPPMGGMGPPGSGLSPTVKPSIPTQSDSSISALQSLQQNPPRIEAYDGIWSVNFRPELDWCEPNIWLQSASQELAHPTFLGKLEPLNVSTNIIGIAQLFACSYFLHLRGVPGEISGLAFVSGVAACCGLLTHTSMSNLGMWFDITSLSLVATMAVSTILWLYGVYSRMGAHIRVAIVEVLLLVMIHIAWNFLGSRFALVVVWGTLFIIAFSAAGITWKYRTWSTRASESKHKLYFRRAGLLGLTGLPFFVSDFFACGVPMNCKFGANACYPLMFHPRFYAFGHAVFHLLQQTAVMFYIIGLAELYEHNIRHDKFEKFMADNLVYENAKSDDDSNTIELSDPSRRTESQSDERDERADESDPQLLLPLA